jgi:nitrite reductase/ring-hydroxylating ferredoxin subunit
LTPRVWCGYHARRSRQVAAAEAFVDAGAWVPQLALVEATWVSLTSTISRPKPSQRPVEMLLNPRQLTVQDADVVAARSSVSGAHPRLGFSDCLVSRSLARRATSAPGLSYRISRGSTAQAVVRWRAASGSGVDEGRSQRLPAHPDVARASTLPARWYLDPDILAAEQDAVFARTWQWAGASARLASAGDYVTCEVAGDPLFAVRGRDGALRAFWNVCPAPRGRIVEGCGNRPALQCRYHGWTYKLDGSLLRARRWRACRASAPRRCACARRGSRSWRRWRS